MRAEHLDLYLYCFNSNGNLSVKYHKLDSNGRLFPAEEELNSDTLMLSRAINLDDWLKNRTIQGLPRKSISDGESSYLNLKENSVARFGAGSGRVVLNCSRYPQYSYAELGVRVARVKI